MGGVGAIEDVHQDHDDERPAADLVDEKGPYEQPHVTVAKRIPVTARGRFVERCVPEPRIQAGFGVKRRGNQQYKHKN